MDRIEMLIGHFFGRKLTGSTSDRVSVILLFVYTVCTSLSAFAFAVGCSLSLLLLPLYY